MQMEALRCDAVLPRARVYPSLATQTQRSIIGVGLGRLKNFFREWARRHISRTYGFCAQTPSRTWPPARVSPRVCGSPACVAPPRSARRVQPPSRVCPVRRFFPCAPPCAAPLACSSFAQSIPAQTRGRCPYPPYLSGAVSFMANMTDMDSFEAAFALTARRKPRSENHGCFRVS